MYNFISIHSYAKKLYLHMFGTVDTVFSYERELIVCSFLQDFSKGKESNLQLTAMYILHFYFEGRITVPSKRYTAKLLSSDYSVTV